MTAWLGQAWQTITHKKTVAAATVFGFPVAILALSVAVVQVVDNDDKAVTNNTVTNNTLIAQPVEESTLPPKAKGQMGCPTHGLTKTLDTGAALSIRKSGVEEECFVPKFLASVTPTTVTVRLQYKNISPKQTDDVIVQLRLPDGLRTVPNTSMIYNGNHPDGTLLSDNIDTAQGINIGSHAANASSFVIVNVGVPPTARLPCGTTEYQIVALAAPFNSDETAAPIAAVEVARPC
ncbi:hypothetical protein ACFVAV_35450 [Nocardia sp. NPDC057663]|uniref:hypothetical protein n=1 Tax=Nocardia sp. NPDC057663 TaxID=3346201 RepID=UPI00366B3BD5